MARLVIVESNIDFALGAPGTETVITLTLSDCPEMLAVMDRLEEENCCSPKVRFAYLPRYPSYKIPERFIETEEMEAVRKSVGNCHNAKENVIIQRFHLSRVQSYSAIYFFTVMNQNLETRLFNELKKITLIDPHSHINPHSPSSTTIADVLGYHYYTELAHSAGLAKNQIEPPADGNGATISPREKVSRLMGHLGKINNTVQWSWMLDLSKELLGWEEPTIDLSNWEKVYDLAERHFSKPNWEEEVLQRSNVESIFLTNDFDDPLVGFKHPAIHPLLEDGRFSFSIFILLQFGSVWKKCCHTSLTDLGSLRNAIGQLFQQFTAKAPKPARSRFRHRSFLRL